MSNHFHLLLREKTEKGISKYMHKIGTGFTKYFNLRNERIGNLFVKPFRSKHISDDQYLQRVLQYIHLNPAELFEPGWKKGRVRNFPLLKQKLLAYPYSSFIDYYSTEVRPKRAILDEEAMSFFTDNQSIEKMLAEATEYYAEFRGDATD